MGLEVVRVAIGGDYRASVDVLAQCIAPETMMMVASAPSLPQLEAELRERQAAVREAFTEIVGPVVRRSE